MTVNIQFPAVAESLSQLSISGVNVFDVDTIPADASRSCPALYPAPAGFITDLEFVLQSFGNDANRKIDIAYTLNYRFLYAPIGSASLLQNYAGLIDKLAIIIEKILSNSTPDGAVNMDLLGVSNIGAMMDEAGQTMYHGVDIALRVLEFAQ